MSTKIIPLNNKNIKSEEEEDSNSAKSMMMEMAIDTFMGDSGMQGKLTGLMKVFSKPAFKKLVEFLKNDSIRIMMYQDVSTGDVVFHKFKIKDDTSEEPKQGEFKVTTADGRKVILNPNGTWREVAFDEPDSSVILEFLFTAVEEDDILFKINENDLDNLDNLAKQAMSKFGGMKMEF